MKNINNKGVGSSADLAEKEVKKLIMFAAAGLKLGRRIYEQLQSVEESLEIVAREIKRISDKAK